MDKYKTYINNKLDKYINELFLDIQIKEDIQSGDITPLQLYKLDELKDSLTDIIIEVLDYEKNDIEEWEEEEE